MVPLIEPGVHFENATKTFGGRSKSEKFNGLFKPHARLELNHVALHLNLGGLV